MQLIKKCKTSTKIHETKYSMHSVVFNILNIPITLCIIKQGYQCTYNVTLRLVRANIDAL